MSKETEKIFRELHKALEEQNFENDMQLESFIDNFVMVHNEKISAGLKNSDYDSYDYLEMAEEALTDKEAIKYAQKAIELDPYCLDAELVIAQAKAKDFDSLKKSLEKIIKKGEEQLKERDISMVEDAGAFYGILETRPYMRVRKTYLELLITQGRFKHAMAEAEELLRLCENDNLGIRYILIALYCYFEDEAKAMELFNKYKEETAFMLLPLSALYYKLENNRKMKSYIMKLMNCNQDFEEALEILMHADIEAELIDEIMSSEMYAPFSLEEVILSFSQAVWLYMPMAGFLPRIYKEVEGCVSYIK